MSDQRRLLESMLHGNYSFERELGGARMLRVFVAGKPRVRYRRSHAGGNS